MHQPEQDQQQPAPQHVLRRHLPGGDRRELGDEVRVELGDFDVALLTATDPDAPGCRLESNDFTLVAAEGHLQGRGGPRSGPRVADFTAVPSVVAG
ncbi:hypothetical protein ACFXEL_24535 [Streptomyces sp. NPDC059382]|uniref:hypothetical protein n=1 Tax=unclassified Streptomyces TaxID=2593676 RepID=UPI00332F6E7F